MGVLYEVRLEPDPAIAVAFLAWLREHIEAMCALPGFDGAQLWAEEQPTPVYVVHYRLQDRAALARYFAEHAAAMRADGLARFPDQFHASRRVLTPV